MMMPTSCLMVSAAPLISTSGRVIPPSMSPIPPPLAVVSSAKAGRQNENAITKESNTAKNFFIIKSLLFQLFELSLII